MVSIEKQLQKEEQSGLKDKCKTWKRNKYWEQQVKLMLLFLFLISRLTFVQGILLLEPTAAGFYTAGQKCQLIPLQNGSHSVPEGSLCVNIPAPSVSGGITEGVCVGGGVILVLRTSPAQLNSSHPQWYRIVTHTICCVVFLVLLP